MSAAKANKERCAVWTADYIARSKKFVACMFLGRAVYDKREASTLEEARKVRALMEKEYSNDPNKRPIMIYAITPDHLSIHVE